MTLARHAANSLAQEEGVELARTCYGELHRDIQKALADCNEAVRLAPDEAGPYYSRAFAHRMLGEFELAQADADRATELAPQLAFGWLLRCSLDMVTLRAADTTRACNRAVSQAPRNVDMYYNRMVIRLDQHDYQGALADARKVASLKPRSARGQVALCQVYVAIGRINEALSACAQAVRAPHDSRTALLIIPGIFVKAGAWTTAMMYADTAVKQMPKSAEAYNERCWVRIRINDVDGATRDCTKALILAPGDPHIRDTRADIEIRVRDYRGVIADENAEIAASPGSPYGYGGRCLAELGLGANQPALRDCLRAAQNQPWDGEWLVRLGDVYRSLGRRNDALHGYRLAYERDPSAFGALRGESQLALLRGDATSAANLARSYVAYNGYDPTGREVYGQALSALGQRAEALEQFHRALKGYQRRSDRIEEQQIAAEMSKIQPLKSVSNRGQHMTTASAR